MSSCILITGALGFVGSEFLRRFLNKNPSADIILLARRKNGHSVSERFDLLWQEFLNHQPELSEKRFQITLLETDLSLPHLGLDSLEYERLCHQVTEIFHFASDIRFDLTLEEARFSNLLPTQHLIALAQQASSYGQFRHFHYLSTFAVSRPDETGVARELPTPTETSFRNTYEQTKAESENLLLPYQTIFPLSIYRPSIIVGDSKTGWTPQFDHFYLVIRLFLSGLVDSIQTLSLPKNCTLDLVSINEVTDRILELSQSQDQRSSGQIFHLVSGRNSATLSELLRVGMRSLGTSLHRAGEKTPQFPEICEVSPDSSGIREAHSRLVSDPEQEVYHLIERLIPYAFHPFVYESSLPELSSALTYLPTLIEYCIQSHWGEEPHPRPKLSLPSHSPTQGDESLNSSSPPQ